MNWRRNKPPAIPLVEGDTLNLKALTPRLASILKTCVGKLDRTGLEPGEVEHIQILYHALTGESYTIVTRNFCNDYGEPVEYIKAIPPPPKPDSK